MKIYARYMTLHHNDQGSNDGPVTVIVTRRAKKERINEFEEWMDGIIHEAMKFEGHMGVNIIRPTDPANPEYVVIFRFKTFENLTKWEKSEVRKKWLDKSNEVAEGEPTVEKLTGLEFWFTPRASGDNAPVVPPRYKMAIVITGIIFVLTSILLPQIRQLTIGLPFLVSNLVGVVLMVLLMTYVIMPSATRLLRPWLAKKRLF